MKKLHYIFSLLLLLIFGLSLNAQVEAEQKVISSGGAEVNTSRVKVSTTIGEAIVTTATNLNSTLVLTQGFQQSFESDSLSIYLNITNAACIGRNNGRAAIDSIVGCEGPYQVIWNAGGSTNDSTAINLKAGDYLVQVLSNDGCSKIVSFTIGYESNEDCFIDFVSGISPNGDGMNDFWVIENIEAFPVNKVTIFNRLGNIVFQENNYNNESTVWGGTNLSGGDLPSDTYFYVFEANGNFEKGWIELIR